MDSVLDFLFLRRLKFEYTSPPICPITPASASGLGITGQVISPILAMPAPVVLNNAFLVWNCQPGDICYNVYEAFGSNFVEVAQCLPPSTITFCSAGCWTINAVVNGIEQPGVGPFCIDGTKPFTAELPVGTLFHVYKNGALTLVGSFCVAYETCMNACYAVTRVTPDGESPLSGTGCTNPLTPSIVITTPADGTTVAPLTVVPIVAAVTLEGNTANSVQFYDSGLPIGAPIPAPGPYTITQTPTLGHHVYTAVLTFNGTQRVTSNIVNLIVQDSLHDVAAYWRLNDPSFGTRLDAVGTNHLADTNANEPNGGGLVYALGLAMQNTSPGGLQHADNSVLGAGPGVSFSFSFWVKNTVNLSPGRPVLTKATNIIPTLEYNVQIQPDGNVGWRVEDTMGNQYQLDSGVSVGGIGTGPWVFVACGYDASIKQSWIQCNNSPMVTTTTLFDVIRTTNPLMLFNFADLSFTGSGAMSGLGLWKRRLTNAEITRLYNGGAGYPLESFFP